MVKFFSIPQSTKLSKTRRIFSFVSIVIVTKSKKKNQKRKILFSFLTFLKKSPRDRAEKSGWFSKSIRKNKKNIKVWISLHNYFLYLWTKPKDTTPLGIIPLEFYSVRKIIEKGEIVLVLERLFLEFDIEDEEQRLITLSTETPEEIDEWFEVLLTKVSFEKKNISFLDI